MCVLLCANSKVVEWAAMPLAIAYREALQLCPMPNTVATESSQPGENRVAPEVEGDRSAETVQLHAMKRSAWLQAYWRYRMRGSQRDERVSDFFEACDSTGEWQKAFEAIAKTWGRLLSLVGLRR